MDTTDDVSEPVDSTAPEYVVQPAVDTPTRRREPGTGLSRWLLRHQVQPAGPAAPEAHRAARLVEVM